MKTFYYFLGVGFKVEIIEIGCEATSISFSNKLFQLNLIHKVLKLPHKCVLKCEKAYKKVTTILPLFKGTKSIYPLTGARQNNNW